VFKGARVNNILSDENGKVIWALTDGGLMKVDVTTLSVESIPLTPLKTSEIEVTAGLLKGRTGRFFIGVASGGILVLEKDGSFSRIHQEILEAHINGFCQTEDGQIWMVTQDQGVYVMDERNLELNRPKLNSGDEFSTNRFFSILKDSEDNVWIGSENEGLYVVYKNTEKLVHYKNDPSKSHSLINTSVHSIYQDAFGRVWVGSFNQGVSYWDPYGIKFQTHKHRNEPQSLSSNAVSVFEKHPENGKVWIGTDGGGLNVWNKENNTFSSFQKGKTKGFTSNAILSLHRNSRNGLWIGTWGGGLMYKEEENDFFLGYEELGTKLNSNLPETPLHVFQIIPDENENLWLATFDRGLCYYDLKTNTITSYTESGEDKMASELAMCLAITKSKEIWVGTVTGLHKFTPKNDGTYSIKLYSQLQESGGKLPNNYIQTLYLDKKEQLWIGTAGGLCLYNPASDDFQTFTKKDGLPSNNIFSILEDEKGLLWVSCSRGLFTLNPENNQVNTFGIQDGIQDLSFSKNASIQLEDGEMLFGGVTGFNTFYPRNIKQNPTAPKLYFTDLKLFNKPVEISSESEILSTPLEYVDELKLNYTQSVFTIEYIGLSLTHSEKNQYAYRLKGLEDEWNFVGNNTSATYTNLDGGTYTFMLKAANNDGLWTESPKELTIVISPPWWKMVWVQVGAILLLIVSSIAFYKMRVERLKRQKARLENTVKERTQEIKKKNDNLLEVNKALEASEEELMQNSEELLITSENITLAKQEIEEMLQKEQQNIKKLKLAQSSLIQAEKMSSLGQMVAGVAHEINNPINFISGGTQGLRVILQDFNEMLSYYQELHTEGNEHLIKEKLVQIAKIQEESDFAETQEDASILLGEIEIGVNRTTEIVKGLKNFSRSGNDKKQLANIHEGIDSTLLLLRSKFKSRVEIVKKYDENLPQILCYPNKLNQVFMNLIGNALDAIEGKGKLVITTETQKNKISISISDSGMGIPEEIRSKVFDPFFTTKEVGKGTGLGLSISYAIIESHDGSLEVESQLGEGTTFIITLPTGN
ncbi:MAG: signal transduction histidine kinase/ligand-binding sensor domain-containing protein, partial [Bacteroidia bacterium]